MDKQQIVLCEDTRQQANKHDLKHEYFDRKGIKVIRSKLFSGDYTLLMNQSICVDTKKDVSELYGDMFSYSRSSIDGKKRSNHERFRNEADRAKNNGIKLYILVENKEGFKDIDDLLQWQNPQLKKSRPKGKKPPVPNEQFVKALHTFSDRHGAVFRFVSPENSGRAILYLLTGKDFGV